jgi:hypothetical protein
VFADGVPGFTRDGSSRAHICTVVNGSYNPILNGLMRFNSSAVLGLAILLGTGRAMAQDAPVPSSAATDTAVASAYKAANVWLDQLDGAQYGPSWDNASATFQHAVTRDQWVATVQRVRGQVGPLGERSLQEGKRTSTAPNLPAGDYVTLRFRTVAANPAHVTETVVMERDGARGWRVIGYFVRP